jgi:hypothetical protein
MIAVSRQDPAVKGHGSLVFFGVFGFVYQAMTSCYMLYKNACISPLIAVSQNVKI